MIQEIDSHQKGRLQINRTKLESSHDATQGDIGISVINQSTSSTGVVIQPRHSFVTCCVDGVFVGATQFVTRLTDGLAHVEHVRLQSVARLHPLPLLLVLLPESLGVVHHAVDVLFAQPPFVVLDDDVGRLARALVLGCDGHDAVGVNVKGHLDLRNTSRGGWDARQFEATQQVVVFCQGALTFVHLDGDGRLVVGVGGEDLRCLVWNCSVALHQLGHDAASRLDAKRQGRHVHQQHIADGVARVATQHRRLHGRSVCNSLVGMNGFVQFFATHELRQHLLNAWNTRGAAHQHHFVDLSFVQLGIAQCLLHWLQGLTEQVGTQFFKACAGDARIEVDSLVQRVDLYAGLGTARQRTLSALARRQQPSNCTCVLADVLLVLALKLLAQMLHHAAVKVFATQMRVSCCGFHFEKRALADLQDGHVEGAATQVENENVLFSFRVLIQSVGQRGGCGFIDDAQDVEAGDVSCIFRGLSLGVVEVGRHGDDSILDTLTQIRLGRLFHLDQHHGADLFWCKRLGLALVLHLYLGFAAVVDHLEGPMLHVRLHAAVVKTPADHNIEKCPVSSLSSYGVHLLASIQSP
ncbi:hypothetical protein C0Q70_00698 [Pomacea canaliculata]|uniref:Uncharacterized protein n=1 Tax=Pomacea canaliculata TaxID=400727 RepID=A0A2T7PXH5_POMCA|nr:hypothetical protein C0Q70_00698 [Pomacea canaliculata]